MLCHNYNGAYSQEIIILLQQRKFDSLQERASDEPVISSGLDALQHSF